jgi:hypothetical protein
MPMPQDLCQQRQYLPRSGAADYLLLFALRSQNLCGTLRQVAMCLRFDKGTCAIGKPRSK